MRDELHRVLELQSFFDPKTTPAMSERGALISSALPGRIRAFASQLSTQLTIPAERLLIKGSNGEGLNSQVPWVRVADKVRAPKTTEGWYCCYLFNGTGTGVWLALMQGANEKLPSGDYRRRHHAELQDNVDWVRGLLAGDVATEPALMRPIDLEAARSKVATSYELGTAISIRYSKEAIPDDQELQDDLLRFSGYLRRVYEATDTGRDHGGDTHRIAYIVARYVDALLRELRQTSGDPERLVQGLDPEVLAITSSVLIERELPVLSAIAPLDALDHIVRPRVEAAVESESRRIPQQFGLSSETDVIEERVSMLVAAKPVRRPPAIARPKRKSVSVTCVVRSAEVVAWVLNRAAGRCEHCNMDAPFMRWDPRLKTERPYLEVHHVHRLADNGPDSIQNAVALCPNCHRRCHHSTDSAEVRQKLEAYLAEVEPP